MSRLNVERLTKKYNERSALQDFSFQIGEGEIVGLIGKNGAGKTTLINCIAGNALPNTGEIFFNGYDLLQEPQARGEIGFLIEASFIDYLPAYDNLQLLMCASGETNKKENQKHIEEVLAIAGLTASAYKKVAGYSYGMKQRLGFAQALLNGKGMLILDEPFAGLDINGRQIVKDHIRKIVKERKLSVLFSDHNLDEVRDLCSRVICIDLGKKVYDGNMSDEVIHFIELDCITPDLESQLSKWGAEIDRSLCIIRVKGNQNLTEIFKAAASNAEIKSIDTIQNSLEKFLREGS